jgi:hypothetical protein
MNAVPQVSLAAAMVIAALSAPNVAAGGLVPRGMLHAATPSRKDIALLAQPVMPMDAAAPTTNSAVAITCAWTIPTIARMTTDMRRPRLSCLHVVMFIA